MRLYVFCLILFTLHVKIVASSASTISYPWSVTRKWDLTSQYTTQKSVSWSVKYEGIYNKETLWVKEELQIDFYDIGHGMDTPVKRTFFDLSDQTRCKSSSTFMITGNKFMSIHGNDQYCTCPYDPDTNPCPHKLQISTTGPNIDYAGKYQFYTNTVQPIDEIEPDVVLPYAMAQPSEACDDLTNPADIDGKYCVVYRGTCFFQTKYDMCMAAGAEGVIVVMLDDSTGAGFSMWVTSVNKPMVGITNSLGESLRADYEAGRRDITIGLGKGIGVDEPDPDYSHPEPLVTVNYYTGEKTEDEASHFTTVQTLMINSKTDMIHFIGVDGDGTEIQVYDGDQSPPQYVGRYSVDINGYYRFIYREPGARQPGVTMAVTDPWANSVKFFDMDDELKPVQIGELMFEPCHPDFDYLGYMVVHPSQMYVYLVPSIHLDACPFEIRLYDITSFASPQKVTNIHIPEVEYGADLWSFSFGLNNVAALTLSSKGVSWYDFSDPANPTALAHIDISEVENTYTLGARSTRQLADGMTYVIMDETEYWYNFHAVTLINPDEHPTCPECAACPDFTSACQTLNEEKKCDDNESLWMVVAIIFIVLAILGCFGMAFFFFKWNMEVSFKFHQMGEMLEKDGTGTANGGTRFDDP